MSTEQRQVISPDMVSPESAGYLFALLAIAVIFLQLALVFGAPWGELSMGGKHSGKLPPGMRFAALIQAFLLLLFTAIVWSRSGLIQASLLIPIESAIWIVVVINMLSIILHTITSSKKEKMLGLPVSVVMLICSGYLALS